MFQLLGVVTLLFVIPVGGMVKINMQDKPIQDWTFLHWLILVTSILSYIFFVIGVFYLRRLSREILDKKYLTTSFVFNLRKTGKMFIVSGLLIILIFLIETFSFLLNDKVIKLVYNTEFILSLFIIAIGLFFIIQSKVVLTARELKQENDLTI